jgi:hypothetical protein
MLLTTGKILRSGLLQFPQFGQTRNYYYDLAGFAGKIHKVIVLSYFLYSTPEKWERAGMFRY